MPFVQQCLVSDSPSERIRGQYNIKLPPPAGLGIGTTSMCLTRWVCRYETSQSERVDLYYLLGNVDPLPGQTFNRSWVAAVSTAEATRGQILCTPIQVPAFVHCGNGDISMGPDRYGCPSSRSNQSSAANLPNILGRQCC